MELFLKDILASLGSKQLQIELLEDQVAALREELAEARKVAEDEPPPHEPEA